MAEPDAVFGDADQSSLLGCSERQLAGLERPPGTEDDRRIAGLLGCGRKEQRLGRLRQATDPLDEQPLDPGADRQRVGGGARPASWSAFSDAGSSRAGRAGCGDLDQARANI